MRFTIISVLASGLASAPMLAHAGGATAGQEPIQEQAAAPLTIRVKLVADAREPLAPKKWEERLRRRLAAASAIIEKTCGVRFEAVAVATWDGDPAISGRDEAMGEFRQKVDPAPADLAIGFTTKYRDGPNCHWLGTSSGVLCSHILVREWYSVTTEVERLEVLVHELGHYLGAAHSAESNSVMRPQLGDGKARSSKFQITFDAQNSRLMELFAVAIRRHDFRTLVVLEPKSQAELQTIYQELARKLPADPVAAAYLKRLAPPSGENPKPSPRTPMVDATRQVLATLCAAVAKRTGETASDRHTEFCFREAAAAALQVPADQAVPAYLLALGIAMDSSSMLRKNPLTGELWKAIESDEERAHRLELIGMPTMWGRHDLAQHFCVSAALSAVVGPKAAREIGLLKEMSDARGGSGFSFADLAADLAGIQLADQLRASHLTLQDLAGFAIKDFAVAPRGLPEGLNWKDFVRDYGSFSDPRFRAQENELLEKVHKLAGYRRK